MKTLGIIILVVLIGYVLFLIFGVILCLTSSPEEQAQIRRNHKKKMQERQLRKYKRWSNRNYFWNEFLKNAKGPCDI